MRLDGAGRQARGKWASFRALRQSQRPRRQSLLTRQQWWTASVASDSSDPQGWVPQHARLLHGQVARCEAELLAAPRSDLVLHNRAPRLLTRASCQFGRHRQQAQALRRRRMRLPALEQSTREPKTPLLLSWTRLRMRSQLESRLHRLR